MLSLVLFYIKWKEANCRLSKNQWGQVIRKQRRKANHSHTRCTKTRRLKPAS